MLLVVRDVEDEPCASATWAGRRRRRRRRYAAAGRVVIAPVHRTCCPRRLRRRLLLVQLPSRRHATARQQFVCMAVHSQSSLKLGEQQACRNVFVSGVGANLYEPYTVS